MIYTIHGFTAGVFTGSNWKRCPFPYHSMEFENFLFPILPCFNGRVITSAANLSILSKGQGNLAEKNWGPLTYWLTTAGDEAPKDSNVAASSSESGIFWESYLQENMEQIIGLGCFPQTFWKIIGVWCLAVLTHHHFSCFKMIMW